MSDGHGRPPFKAATLLLKRENGPWRSKQIPAAVITAHARRRQFRLAPCASRICDRLCFVGAVRGEERGTPSDPWRGVSASYPRPAPRRETWYLQFTLAP